MPSDVLFQVDWLKAKNFAGYMLWSLDMDDFKGIACHQGAYPIASAISSRLLNDKPTTSTENSVLTTRTPGTGSIGTTATTTSTPTTTTTTQTSTTPSTTASTSPQSQKFDQGKRNFRMFSERTSTCTGLKTPKQVSTRVDVGLRVSGRKLITLIVYALVKTGLTSPPKYKLLHFLISPTSYVLNNSY